MDHQKPTDDSAAKPESIVLAWWANLVKPENRGRRAELRRAKTLAEVVFTPAFHDLRRRLAETPWRNVDRVALIAAVVAAVDEHDGTHTAASQMAASRGAVQQAPVSDLRFRRLLRLTENDQLFRQLPRVVRLLDQRANVPDLANGMYWWNERVRKAWALEYYDNLPTQS